jgi:RHS repeat-associated protein
MKLRFLFCLFFGLSCGLALGQNVTFAPLHNSNSFQRNINVNLPVGTTPGEANVSGIGSAAYSVPIIVPPGSNQITPSLSIDYNSNSGNGPLGTGWSINGLSVISRVGKSFYYDGEASPVEMSLNDRFVMDGSRLVLTGGSYGTANSTYATEQESFSTVTAKGTFGNGPEWFEVVTKDSVVLEYGNTQFARFKDEATTSSVMFWRLNKVIYPDGNYIEYTYVSTDRDSRVTEIRYTGNSVTGRQPFNKISFSYVNRSETGNSADYITTYSAGSSTVSKYLLDMITISAEQLSFKKYKFSYGTDKINIYLTQIEEIGSDGTSKLNPTIFKYGDEPSSLVEENGPQLPSTAPTANFDYFSGDHDGNGRSDLVLAAYTNYQYNTPSGVVIGKEYKAFNVLFDGNLNNSTGFIQLDPGTQVRPWSPSKKDFSFLKSDFDGEGRDDILTCRIETTNFSTGQKATLTGITIYYSRSSSGNQIQMQPGHYPADVPGKSCIPQNGNYIFDGDFDGDGKNEFFTLLKSHDGVDTYANYYALNNSLSLGWDMFLPVLNSNGSLLGPVWGAAKQVYIIDFDGDGKSDIMTVQGNLTRIYSYAGRLSEGRVSFKLLHSSTTIMKDADEHVYFGDFNRDGKTDFIFRNELGLADRDNPWVKAISKGTSYAKSDLFFYNILLGPGPSPTEDLIQVADFNGDGRSDIYHQAKFGSIRERVSVYYSSGDKFSYTAKDINSTEFYESKLRGVPFDLNGDGRSEIVYRQSSGSLLGLFSTKKEGTEHLLESVSNGYNNITTWRYKNLSSGTPFYTRTGGTSEFPSTFMPASMFCVSDFITQNGIGGTKTVQFNYQGARLHRSGKGFLGFFKVISWDLAMGTRTVVENEFSQTYFAPALKRVATFLESGNVPLTETVYSNQFVTPAASSKRYWVKTGNVTATNALEGRTVTTANLYDGYGNVTQSTVTNNVETIVTNTDYEAHPGIIPNKPSLVTVNKTRVGEVGFNQQTKFTYIHKTGKLESKTEFNGLPKKLETSYTYWPDGNLKQTKTTPFGPNAPDPVTTTITEYDGPGRYPLKVYNELEQLTTSTFSIWGSPASVKGVDNRTTSFLYDAFGRLTSTTYPASTPYTETQTYNWDVQGRSVWFSSVVHPSEPDTKSWYDILGREIKTQTEGFGGAWITSLKQYDERGNVKSTTLPYIEGETLQTVNTLYDVYNRPSSVDMGPKGTTTIAYSYSGGESTETSTSPMGVSSKTSDASGLTIRSTDNGGTLTFEYYSHGGTRTIKNGNTVSTSSVYDEYGKQVKLVDINAGATEYKYNAFGELIEQKNAKGETTVFTYDKLGQITSRLGPEAPTPTTYKYYSSGTSINKIEKVTGFAGDVEDYTYDSQGRLSTLVETLDGQSYTTLYGYNRYHFLTSKTYPSTFKSNYDYDENGYLTAIKNSDKSLTFYKTTSMNGFGQVTAYSLGNSSVAGTLRPATITYENGAPTRYFTDEKQDLNLVWNYQTGNLISRSDVIKSKTESFIYDNLNRLTRSTISGTVATTNYNSLGNITDKAGAGIYTYHPSKLHAVTAVTNPAPAQIPLLSQDISYTPFMQPSVITENGLSLTYTYRADYNRIKSVLKQISSNSVLNTRYYFREFEKNNIGATSQYLQYIDSPVGVVGLVLDAGTNPSTQHKYIYTDHVGSIVTVTNNSGTVEAEQSFDAWGRRRDPGSWALLAPTTSPTLPNWLYRGYTGHEHLDQFGLINMNGRMYDPLVGRMLSPDNYVQDPFGTQDYNRYTYAKNNPLTYIDPDGNLPIIPYIIAGIVGGGTNLFNNRHKVKDLASGLSYFGNGAIGGVISAVTLNPLAAAGATGALNVGTDLLTGQMPKFNDGFDAASYIFSQGSSGLSAAAAGQLGIQIYNQALRITGNAFRWGKVGGGDLVMEGSGYVQGKETLSRIVVEDLRITGAARGGQQLLTAGRFPNLAKKFGKHADEWSEWGSISQKAYYNRAVKLADGSVGGHIHGFTSKQGWNFRFNSKTGEFLTTHPQGHIETFFRPTNGMDYYLKQLMLYGQ